MSTLGWILILVAVLLARAVAKGRALNIPQDLGDAFQAFVDGRSDDLAEVFNRTGDTNTAVQADTSIANTPITDIVVGQAQAVINQSIVKDMYMLAKAAKGYKFGAAGPDYYDCSGLVYRALQKVGYIGPRFFTATVSAMPGFKSIDSNQVTAGDIVLWPGHHMGAVTGSDRFFSALNPKAGFAERQITGFRKGETPVYLRFTQNGK